MDWYHSICIGSELESNFTQILKKVNRMITDFSSKDYLALRIQAKCISKQNDSTTNIVGESRLSRGAPRGPSHRLSLSRIYQTEHTKTRVPHYISGARHTSSSPETRLLPIWRKISPSRCMTQIKDMCSDDHFVSKRNYCSIVTVLYELFCS